MKKERLVNIEFARIIACFMVICIHTVTWYIKGNKLMPNSLLIRCFITDGVPIFWYIMGYFLFTGKPISQIKRIKKVFFSLLLPAFLVMVFSQIWQDYILADIGRVKFLSCLDMHSFDMHNLFGNILLWKEEMTFGGHFWYVFSYFQVVLWVPLIKYVCVENAEADKTRRYLMFLCILYIISKDIQKLRILSINGKEYPITVYSVITPTILFVLIGYEFYRHRNFINNNKIYLKWVGVIGYLVFNLIKYNLSIKKMEIDVWDSYFCGISTVCGYLASISIFLFILCVNIKTDTVFESLVYNISSKTLGIYLIHGVVYRKMKAIGIRERVYSPYFLNPNNIFIESACTIIYAAYVFVVCYLIVLLWQIIKRYIQKYVLKNIRI